ncbi:MAG: triose-phosphate isomerase [Chloroflexi bacterium]|nr:MAG: triose-phosphate isomerase [Anaerolineaceae bacterium 4572_32.2]RLC77043.1 MAG: triose-phosphate isomerase [Chloroflexota bacterium]RLC83100.1 MAG: triose-phosphate isomerase [Chloroflexota bacterium]HEY71948.1 triose-phosphate isomerase [Thermoflexia bacterium]
MRKPFIAGNWKMHKTIKEAVTLVEELRAALAGIAGCDVAVCPPAPALAAVREALSGSDIGLGAQNVHWEEQGAFTGEVSPPMLVGLCDYAIVGHSERRTIFGESDEWVNKKLRAALAHGLKPILCVGENLQQNQAGETEEFVGGQVRAAFAGVTAEQARVITVAYEPIWAIGTGVPATGESANDIIGSAVRGALAALYGDDVAQDMRIQYGGSVKPGNAAEFMAQPEIDGALVGGASLRAADFAAIVRAAAGK